MNQALLIIDVQHALSHGVYACFDADRVIERINAVSAKARAAGVPVILIQHQSVGGVLDHGSEGWQLAAGLDVQPGDIRLGKTATDAFHKTELQALLQRLGVERLVVCGFQSDFCVDTTVRRALGLGYPVSLVADGHSTLDNGVLHAAQITAHHNATLAGIGSYGPRVSPVAAAELSFEPQAGGSQLVDRDDGIRLATLADLEPVAALFDAYRQFYEQAPDVDLATRFIGERLRQQESVILLARDVQGQAIGFCQLYPSFCSVEARPIYALYDLYVAPAARRSGTGRALLRAAEQLALEHGKARMDLTTAKTNRAAQSVYESLGWVRDEVFYAYSRQLGR